ncbi:homoserine dehydrogenase [Brevundimonas variabilis]|uniref:Homoserine dehydrogenase n=1 Tax=Brevundimonas variabilis TaxID=74312 RepID=A0A7W9FEV4_9CAUL|nr:homoserine dehydrogenase [Brevundimonas variabilis]MBB5746757.1 homoserine dehydrogenase [Brevundimonas variabilis]
MPYSAAHLAVVPSEPLKPGSAASPAPDVVVLKFGSSILKSAADAPVVASEIYGHVRAGRKVVAVVSAFAGHTDRLLAEARSLGLDHENDLLPGYVALGEEKAAAFSAIACDRIGLGAVALSVRELGIVADGPLQHAHPCDLRGDGLRQALEQHQVVVVPGFGAVRPDGRVALLGRGGSDLTAVFIAAELGLKRVRLVKDVDGLYDRDPASASGKPLRYRRASWDDARRHGGALVQHGAIDMAHQRGVEIEVAALGRADCTVVGDHSAPPGPSVPDAPVRVAIAGCGVVGGGLLARLLVDPRFQVVGVLVRDPRKARDVDAPVNLFTSDREALLNQKPDLLLEALSEGGAGHDLIRCALERGIDVASANKQAISRDPAGLAALAQASGARLAYSAAVGGGAPMIETLRAARAAGPVAGFEAVLNGTVNFMLGRLEAGADFADALADARVAGFAEEDPSSDLEGRDSAAKVRLLAFEAFGETPAEADVPCDVLSDAFVVSGPVRQIGACHRVDGALKSSVRLDGALSDPLFARLRGERNALKVYGEDGRVWSCKGRGAGRWPTTESVLSDVADIVRARHAVLGHH